MTWTLTKIREKVKKIVGRTDMASSEVDEYINAYYQYLLPIVVGASELHTWYEGTTTNGTGEYLLDDDMISIDNPCFIDGEIITLYGANAGTDFFTKYPPSMDATSTYQKPTDVYFYDGVLWLRPIPDDEYTIKVATYKRPTALSLDTDEPLDSMWGPMIAYGAAIEIASEDAEFEDIDALVAMHDAQQLAIEAKNIRRIANQQSIPRF